GEARLERGLARISILGGQGPLWQPPGATGPATHRMVFVKDLPPASAPARLGVSEWPLFSHSPLCGHKLLNYAEPWHCLRMAREAGLDEAVRLNESGSITGGCLCALLWRTGADLFAPSRDCGGLNSTTLQRSEERRVGKEGSMD